jgi:large subunit ribosomal protein L17
VRHLVAGKKLGRDTNSRKALLNNLANAVFLHGKVKTTLAKAKFAKSHIEKTITSAKKAKLGSRRVIASGLSKTTFNRLIDEIVPSFEARSGGYTRIVKLSPRNGDNAPMARIELMPLDKSKTKVSKKSENKKVKKIKPKKTITKTTKTPKPKKEVLKK